MSILRIIKKAHKVFEIILRMIPIRLNAVFFESFGGKYNDNPKYISEELNQTNPKMKIVWGYIGSANKEIPPEMIKVRPGTLRYYIYKNWSKVSVDNYCGTVFHYGKKGGKTISKLINNKHRLNISTWHGTPLKKIGADILDEAKKEGFYSTSSFIIAGCSYTQKCIERSVYHMIPVEILGTPRNDILFRTGKTEELRQKLHLPENKKICLFAPTYRDSVELSGVTQLKELNTERLLMALHQRFGGEWVFVFRVHHTVEQAILNESILKDKVNVINGNDFEDMAEYLYITDFLITDYSGSLFDYALTRKPCVLWTPDKEEYEKKPGLYMDMSELPFDLCYSSDELIERVECFDSEKNISRIDSFLKKTGNSEDGNASKRISERIVQFMKSK